MHQDRINHAPYVLREGYGDGGDYEGGLGCKEKKRSSD